MATPNPLEPVKGAGTTLWGNNRTGASEASPATEEECQLQHNIRER
ncbi:hypothetical protein [Escherichia coli]